MVRVTNAQNGREVRVVINDRGPFIRGRVIDLSYAVAQQLGVVKQGTIPVLIEVVLMGNRGAMPPFVRMTEMEQGDGVTVGWYVLWVAPSEDPRDGDAWISEVGNLVRPAARGSRDVLRAPPRSRKSRV